MLKTLLYLDSPARAPHEGHAMKGRVRGLLASPLVNCETAAEEQR